MPAEKWRWLRREAEDEACSATDRRALRFADRCEEDEEEEDEADEVEVKAGGRVGAAADEADRVGADGPAAERADVEVPWSS